MKNLFFGLICLISLNVNGQEMDIIQETINKLFIATDQHDWQQVEQCFAEHVMLDYASMTSNSATTISAQQIIASWKEISPGFDHTHHQTGNFIITTKGNTASAFCYGTASHYLTNDQEHIWTVVGSYDFELKKVKHQWKITGMRFNLKYQDGNLELPQMAITRLQSETKNTPVNIGERNKQQVLNFLKALEEEHIDNLVNLFADDAQHINPYHSDIFPKGASGKDGIRAYWIPVFSNFEGMQFPVETIYAMEDPNIIYVKFKGIIKLKNDAGYYKNDYYATFTFNEKGLITEYVEIFNPITAAKSFGLIDNIK